MFRIPAPRTEHAGTLARRALVGVGGDVGVAVQVAQRERHGERRQRLAGFDARRPVRLRERAC